MRPSNEESVHHEMARDVARLWPHRKHESPALTSFLCGCGVHYWRSLSLSDLYPGKNYPPLLLVFQGAYRRGNLRRLNK